MADWLWSILLHNYDKEVTQWPAKAPPRTPAKPGQRVRLRGRKATGEIVHLWDLRDTVAVLVAWDWESYTNWEYKGSPALICGLTELEVIDV